MSLVSSPIIGIKLGKMKRFQDFFEFQKDRIFTIPKDISQHFSTLMINGMPQPSLIPFLSHEALHFIHFSLIKFLNLDLSDKGGRNFLV